MSRLEEAVKEELVKKNLTYSWLAEKIGYSRQGLKNGLVNKTIKVETLEKIVEVLNVNIFKLFKVDTLEKEGPSYRLAGVLSDSEEFQIAEVLANRYDKFSDRIDCLKDFFVYDVLNKISSELIPFYSKKEFDYWLPHFSKVPKLLTQEQFLDLQQYASELKKIPFSKWANEDVSLINRTNLIKAFHYILFDHNYMNIVQYLEDGMLNENEILISYEEWKKH